MTHWNNLFMLMTTQLTEKEIKKKMRRALRWKNAKKNFPPKPLLLSQLRILLLREEKNEPRYIMHSRAMMQKSVDDI